MTHLTNTFEIFNGVRSVEIILVLISIINTCVIDIASYIKKANFILLVKLDNIIITQISKIWVSWLLFLYTKFNGNYYDLSSFKGVFKKYKLNKKRPINFIVNMNLIQKIKFSKTRYNIFQKLNGITNQPFVKSMLNLYIIKKSLIRKSIFFSKTKYSFIRQECKNIVNLTLLINAVYIILVFSVYMKFKFIFGLSWVVVIIFILLNLSIIIKIKKIISVFFYNVKSMLLKN